LGQTFNNEKAMLLAETLDQATGKWLENDKSPARVVGKLDNRGSHFYLALYWAEALASQTKDQDLQAKFAPLAKLLQNKADQIESELNGAQGKPVDIGGYYRPDESKASTAMRPSTSFNELLKQLS
jgi:isocitrate dehydrogenase